MKHSTLFRFAATTVLGLVLTGCCCTCCSERGCYDYGPFEPKAPAQKSDAEAFHSYGPATSHQEGYSMAYEWQRKDAAAIKAATKPEVLVKFVESDEAADALLAKIGTTYDGDPLVLSQIAAVTQLVMCPKCPKAPGFRKVWVAALKRTRAKTDDGYVRTFCAQQLRLCD